MKSFHLKSVKKGLLNKKFFNRSNYVEKNKIGSIPPTHKNEWSNFQIIKWKTNEQTNNTIKVLEKTWVNLLEVWEWEIFPIYIKKSEVIRGKSINFTAQKGVGKYQHWNTFIWEQSKINNIIEWNIEKSICKQHHKVLLALGKFSKVHQKTTKVEEKMYF